MTQSAPSVIGYPQDTIYDPNDAAAASQPSRLGTAPDTLASELAALSNLDLYGLRVQWRRLMRKPAPEHLHRSLLIRVLAYRMQARVLGDLDAESIRALDTIARDHDRRRRDGQVKPKAVPEIASVPVERGHKPGTMFLREHAGEMHRVTVTRDGFEWQGETYRSLSEIARRITGTTWSGPKFFGLREPAREKPVLPPPAVSSLSAHSDARSEARTALRPVCGASPWSRRPRIRGQTANPDRNDGAAL